MGHAAYDDYPLALGSGQRRFPRALLSGTAYLTDAGVPLGVFRIIDLSASGVLLRGATCALPRRPVEVLLQLSDDRQFRAEGVIVRRHRALSGDAFAVRFSDLGADVEDAIQDAVLEALETIQTASVLIVDDNPVGCGALRARLGALGHRSTVVQTPLDVVEFLAQPNEVEAVLVELMLGHGSGTDVMAFLAQSYPHLTRVLMSARAPACQLALAKHTLARCPVHGILRLPCSAEELALVLGPKHPTS